MAPPKVVTRTRIDRSAGPDVAGSAVTDDAVDRRSGSGRELLSRVSAGTLARAGRRLGGGVADEVGVLVVLALLVAAISVVHPAFLGQASLTSVLRQSAFIAIMAFGMVFLVTMREIDLSVGATYALTIMLAGHLMASGMDPWLAAAAGVAAGAASGLFNGVTAQVLRVPVIIVSLGTLSMYRGLSQTVTDGRPISGLPTTSSFFTWLGADLGPIPLAAVVTVVLLAVLVVVLRSTRFGAQVRGVGSSPAAARFSGVRVGRVRVFALVLMGGLAGISGMMSLAYFGSADPTLGTGYELYVIAAVVIGATPLSGGRGSLLGALIGALIIQVIQSGLVFFAVGANWSTFTTGVVIIAAVALDAVVRRRRRARTVAE